MIEIFHFVNPLCLDCLACERALSQCADRQDQTVIYRLIPVISSDGPFRENDYTILALRVIMDFKSAQLQGNKKANSYLKSIQRLLLEENQEYSKSVVTQAAVEAQLDIDDFLAGRSHSENAISAQQDQKLANSLTKSKNIAIIKNSSTGDVKIIDDFNQNQLDKAFSQINLPKYIS
jgi:predicted DsbA family dithiol-disulfide isomerase